MPSKKERTPPPVGGLIEPSVRIVSSGEGVGFKEVIKGQHEELPNIPSKYVDISVKRGIMAGQFTNISKIPLTIDVKHGKSKQLQDNSGILISK